MTLVAEVQGYDNEARATSFARLVVREGLEPAVVELAPGGASLARGLLAAELVGPDERRVTPRDGADYLRVLRWARSSDRLWISPLGEIAADKIADPGTPFPIVADPFVPATVPYPAIPAGLTDLQAVEICRPHPDDLTQVEVVARVISRAGGSPRLDPIDTSVADELTEFLRVAAASGGPPLDVLVKRRLRPGLAGRWVRFGRPFDKASRNAAVALYRRAIAAGDAEAGRLLAQEYLTRLPRLWLSRCPFSLDVLRLAVDAHGFDGPWFDPVEPLRPLDDGLPASFLGLTAEPPPAPSPGARWPGKPWIVPQYLERPGMRAVFSAMWVGRTPSWLVSYYEDGLADDRPLIAEWGSNRARVPGDGASWQFVAAPPLPARSDDLAPWVKQGKLLWIQPFDQSVTLRTDPNEFAEVLAAWRSGAAPALGRPR